MARGKGEGSLFKNGNGLWEVRVELPPDIHGKRRRKVIRRKNKADAIKELRRLKSELAKTGDLATSGVKLEQWSEEWLANRAERLAPNTVNGYRTAFREYINPLLGKKSLDKIRPLDVTTLHKLVQATPKDKALRGDDDLPPDTEMLSSTYALLVHNTLSGALKMAVSQGLLSANVCEMVDKPVKRHTNEETLDLEDGIKLLKYLSTRDDGVLWATYLLTCARRSEIIGLEIDRVLEDRLDLSWQVVRIKDIKTVPKDREYRHIRANLYYARPKSKTGWRTPPMIPQLKEMLAREIGDRTDGPVFLRNGVAWDPGDASKEWKEILRDAGLNEKVKLHGARHTSIALLYELNVPEATIMQIAGHSVMAVTRKYGQAGNQRSMKEAMSKLGDALFPDTAPKAIEGEVLEEAD